MKKFTRLFALALCVLFPLLCLLYVVFYVFDAAGREEEPTKAIVELWHIDSFEGGKGSRAAFLKRTARKYEKAKDGVYIMVCSYTAEGAQQAIREGKCPDLLSFSCGLDGAAELCRRLPYAFSGGELESGCFAYPWACGKYFLFSLDGDFSFVAADNLILSQGGGLVSCAAAAEGIFCENFAASTSAYVRFLNGDYQYLLGTQRDVCRFEARGTAVQRKEISAYNDLYQYISLTTDEESLEPACREFIDLLLSEETQGELSSIGMYPLSECNASYTLSAFVSGAGREQADSLARAALKSGDTKILKNYLKALN